MMDARTLSQANLAQAALGCICVAVMNLLLMWMLRMGLETHWLDVLKLLVMGGAVCVSPLLISEKWRKPEWAALCVLALLDMVCLSPLLGDGVWLLYAAVLAAGLREAWPHAKAKWLWQVFGVLGLYVFLRSHMEHFAGVYAPEFGRMGILHRDTQLQAAFANMIGQFGAFSVGEGSLAPTPYHVGVNVWMAYVAKASGMEVVSALPFLLRLVAFPALVFAILLSVPQRVPAAVAGALVLAALVAT
ncbi:MAG: hypothetical protein K2Q01_01670, partial [Rickettsiales bacterium]|nr:hypothetical protein [Rickettsiales bacterium]